VSSKPGGATIPGYVWRIPAYCPDGDRHTGGVTLVQASIRNLGTWIWMLREKPLHA